MVWPSFLNKPFASLSVLQRFIRQSTIRANAATAAANPFNHLMPSEKSAKPRTRAYFGWSFFLAAQSGSKRRRLDLSRNRQQSIC
jgi:hypothetical protein